MGLMLRHKMQRQAGQMTIEFVVCLPVLIIVAAIAVNALSFFGICAAFDNNFRDIVRTNATSPAYGQDVYASAGIVEAQVNKTIAEENASASVQAREVSGGHVEFSGVVSFAPTLFGFGLKDEVLGVSLPRITHTETFVVDCYKPGVLF